jgi:hypothetical protein
MHSIQNTVSKFLILKKNCWARCDLFLYVSWNVAVFFPFFFLPFHSFDPVLQVFIKFITYTRNTLNIPVLQTISFSLNWSSEPVSGKLLKGNFPQLTAAHSLICPIPSLSLSVRIFLCMYSYSLNTFLSRLCWKIIKFSSHKSSLISTIYFRFLL